MKRRIILFANTDWNLYNFRLSLARALQQSGCEVVLLSPPGPYVEKMQAAGFAHIACPFSTRSINPLHELRLLWRLYRLYRQQQPDIVHHFTIKSVIYGSLAARLAGGIGIVNTVTGMGHIFTSTGWRTWLARQAACLLYRRALGARQGRVIFQNESDRNSFLRLRLVAAERSCVIRGSGVDTETFAPARKSVDIASPPAVLFASRLLREKGIFEFVSAIQQLQSEGLAFNALVAGDLYPENPSSLSLQELTQLTQTRVFDYLGVVDDMAAQINQVDIVVLPSYREGTPRLLLEGGACGKPLIATDIPGCRGVVRHGENGLLVPVKNSSALADAIRTLLQDPQLRQRMGTASRNIILKHYSDEHVIGMIMDNYARLA